MVSCYEGCMGCMGCGTILGAGVGAIAGSIGGYELTKTVTDSTLAGIASVPVGALGGGMLGWLITGFGFIGAAYVINNFPSRSYTSRNAGNTFKKRDLETIADQKQESEDPSDRYRKL